MAAPGIQHVVDERSFLANLQLQADAIPQAVALIEPGRESLTFSGLQNRIRAAARTLTEAGIRRDDVVAVILPDGIELLTTFLGVASVATCAVVNPALREAELESIFDDLDVRALILDATVCSPAEDVARKRRIAVLNVASGAESSGYDHMEPAGRDSLALLLHTSATTGTARVVELTHANLAAMAGNTCRILGLTAADRFLSMMPLFHLQGLLSSLAQLTAGGSVVCTPAFDAGEFPSWLARYQPTWYTAGPTLHHAILPTIQSHPDILDGSALRFVRSIGAPLPDVLMQELERALHVPVLEGYGMTEAGAITSNAPPPERRKTGSAGRTTGSEIGIMSETGVLLALDAVGEIVVRGPAVMHAYRNNPDANRSAFRDGWLRTGDLGRLDADGFLFVTGRIKEMINRGGEKILPGEIEDSLLAHPAVTEAVAFGVSHVTLGEDVMAAVVLGAPVSEPELFRSIRERIAVFKIPRRIFIVDAIPKGATGKPARAALALQLRSEIDAVHPSHSHAPTEVENQLAAIWRRILKVESVGTGDDFFRLGGDSLALTLLTAEIDIELGAADRGEFLSSPTIETLARIVARAPARSSGQSDLVTLQPHGTRIPLFCIPNADENPYTFLDLADGLGLDQPVFAVRDARPLQGRGVYTVEQHASRFREAICSVRPRGPYILSGHCYGGIVAFEVARQLVARGQEVDLLALFEVPTPGYPKVVRQWKKYFRHSANLVSAMMRGESHAGLAGIRSHLGVWKKLMGRKRQAVIRRVLVSAGMQAVIQPVERIELRNERAGRAYVPAPLHCKVVQFLAAEELSSTLILDDARLGWRDLARSGFSVLKVPGKAGALLKPPNVSDLAQQLRTLLDRANPPEL